MFFGFDDFFLPNGNNFVINYFLTYYNFNE